MVRDVPLGEITLRRYERPFDHSKRELIRKICLSIASGNGKEHLAILSALLNLPIGVRLVVFTKKGVEFLT